MKKLIRNLLSLCFVLVIAGIGLTPLAVADTNPQPPASRQQFQKHDKRVLHLKLRDNSGVALSGGAFVGGDSVQTAKLNEILAKAKLAKAEKLLDRKAEGGAQPAVKQRLSGYYRIRFDKDMDMAALVGELKALPMVETAYAEPLPAPPPSANYVNLQRYLKPAPDGVNASFAKTYPGGNGSQTTIFDLEYSWNRDHEDLSRARGALIANGTPSDPFADNNHGTAVLGQMAADDNTFGVTGIIPAVNLRVINVHNQERGYDLLGALYISAFASKPGDIILIEQQTWGPTPEEYDYVPVEWVPAYYDAIRALSDAGRIIIEAAGNGNQNLDDATWYGSSFPMGKPNSGALIVGAATHCEGTPAPRSRWFLSNYGKRVNLQGPGECVATTGYGDLNFSAGPNAYYTAYFNGTSSAAPVVAAAAASLVSAYKQLNNGAVLKPAEVAFILAATGTPQNTSGPGGNIGPYPNLAKALLVADQKAPSTPANFTGFAYYNVVPVMWWSPSTDNVKVEKYEIFRNGRLYQTVTGTSFADQSVARNTSYSYKVRAVDSAGRKSAFTPVLTIAVK